MNTEPGYLFSKEEIEKACLLIENFFGTRYFKQGIELMKDSDPSGTGMGRLYSGFKASKLLLTWHRSREELVYADLQGFFAPGVHSAVMGVLGKCLEALGDAPGVLRAAEGLLSDTGFDRTFFLLWVSAGFRPGRGQILFPEDPGGCFFLTAERCAAACLRAETGGSGPSQAFSSILEQLPDLTRLLTDRLPGARSIVFYIDLSDLAPQEADPRSLLEYAGDPFGGRLEPDPAALVLCKSQFIPGSAGVRWKTSSFPVFGKKTSGSQQSGGFDIFLP